MTDDKRYALLMSNLYLPNVGGVENSLRSLTEVLVERGYGVDIVCSDLDQSSVTRLPSHETSNYSEVYRYRHSMIFFRRLWAARSLLKSLQSRRGGYCLVMVRSALAVLALRMVGRRQIIYVVPSISSNENSHRASWDNPLSALAHHINTCMQRVALRVAPHIVVLGNNMRAQVRSFTSGKVDTVLINPGVDQKRFKMISQAEKRLLREELGLPTGKDIALCLGRFSPVKGFSCPLEAILHMDADMHLVLVGDGPCESEYRNLINEHGLADRVSIYPKTSQSEMFYRAADIFILSSVYEAFGQVLLEASSAGLPVVAFNQAAGVSTATEEIYEGHDELVCWASVLESSVLAEAMTRAFAKAETRSERFEEQVKAFRRNYSWERMLDELLLLDQVI